MILVNINRTGRSAVTPEQIRDAAAGAWVITDRTIQQHGDVLVAVRNNRVLGAWPIHGHRRDAGGKVTFSLGPAGDSENALVGQPSPARWVRGAANPVKVLPSDNGSEPAEPVPMHHVTLQGWTLRVLPGGRAQITPPTPGGDLVVESLFPSTPHSAVILRQLPAD